MAFSIPESTIEEIKARTDLGELISSYGIAVRTAGGSQKACCPFHNEKTPSFVINAHKGFYHCFGCGESGDAIKFVQKMDGLSFTEAVKRLAGQCGVKIEEREDPEAGRRKRLLALMAELAAFYHRCLLKIKEAEPARAYLASRALDGQPAEDWTIGYAPTGMATILTWAEKHRFTPEELEAAGVIRRGERPGDLGYHRFGGRLMFSIRDKQGRVVAFSGRQLVERRNSGKYVNSPETVIFKKSNVLFGFDRAAGNIAKAPHREVICCEGQIDTIRLHLCGFPVAVASQGTAFTEEHAQMIKRVADAALLMYDDDGAGHKAAVKVAGMLLAREMPVRVVSLPDGDDPDSFLRKHKPDDLQKLIDGAESIVSFQCRVEQAKERDPKSIDAVARVTKAVLATVKQCPSAVLRASMVGEAAKLLGLPAAALEEELSRLPAAGAQAGGGRTPVRDGKGAGDAAEDAFEDFADASDFTDADDVGAEIAGEDPSEPGADAAAVAPPPARETALLAFLMANERDAELDAAVGEFLPATVFAHAFTGRFVEAWRTDVANADGDAVGAFAASLPPYERAWFDAVLLASGRSGASTFGKHEILQDFVRQLWSDALRRRRGELPAAGGPEADLKRLQLTTDLKRLALVKWNAVKEMVRRFKGEPS